jgi:hypothetical protein
MKPPTHIKNAISSMLYTAIIKASVYRSTRIAIFILEPRLSDILLRSAVFRSKVDRFRL